MNGRRYRTHDIPIRGSLERHVGETPADEERVRAMAAAAFHKRKAITFLPCDLERMPEMARRLIEAEASRLYGQRVERKLCR